PWLAVLRWQQAGLFPAIVQAHALGKDALAGAEQEDVEILVGRAALVADRAGLEADDARICGDDKGAMQDGLSVFAVAILARDGVGVPGVLAAGDLERS